MNCSFIRLFRWVQFGTFSFYNLFFSDDIIFRANHRYSWKFLIVSRYCLINVHLYLFVIFSFLFFQLSSSYWNCILIMLFLFLIRFVFNIFQLESGRISIFISNFPDFTYVFLDQKKTSVWKLGWSNGWKVDKTSLFFHSYATSYILFWYHQSLFSF